MKQRATRRREKSTSSVARRLLVATYLLIKKTRAACRRKKQYNLKKGLETSGTKGHSVIGNNRQSAPMVHANYLKIKKINIIVPHLEFIFHFTF
jgi:hypothetical protein